MRTRILFVLMIFAFMCAISSRNSLIADEPETKNYDENFKLRDYLPSYTPIYAEINKPFEFVKELATWEYLNTVLKLNLKSEEVPFFGDLYNVLESVKTIGNAIRETQETHKKQKPNVKIISGLELAIPQINILNIQDFNITDDLIVHLKVHNYADVLMQLILILQTQIEKFEIIKVEQYNTCALLEINTGETNIYVAMMKYGHILVTWKKSTLTKYVDRIVNNEEMKFTLSSSSTYKSAIQSSINKETKVEKSLPRVKVYIYLKQIVDMLSMFLGNDQNFSDGINPFKLGIKDIRALCLNLYFENGKMQESLGIVVSEKRNGVFGFFPTEKCEFNLAKYAPDNVSSIYISQTDMMRIFSHLENVIQMVQPELAPYIRNFVNSAEAFGYNFIEEALKSMNGEFCWWSIYDNNGKLSEVTYLIESKEEKLCKLLVDELAKNLNVEYFLTVEKAEYKKVKYHIFNIEQGLRDTILQLPLELPYELQEPLEKMLDSKLTDKIYVVFSGNKLVLTSSLERMKSMIDNPEGIENSLAKKQDFIDKINDLKETNAASMLYFGDKNFVNGWYDFAHDLFSQFIQESDGINLEIPSKKVFVESFKPLNALSFGGYKNLVEIRTPGIMVGTLITFASFAAKAAIKNEIQTRIKEFYNKLDKK